MIKIFQGRNERVQEQAYTCILNRVHNILLASPAISQIIRPGIRYRWTRRVVKIVKLFGRIVLRRRDWFGSFRITNANTFSRYRAEF